MFNKLISSLSIERDKNIRLGIPHRTLFAFLLVMLMIFFTLVSFSTYYLCLATAPLIAYWCYCFIWFGGVWRGFGYSLFVLLTFAAVTLILGIFVGKPLVHLGWDKIKMLF